MPSHPHSTGMFLQSRSCIIQVLRFSLAWPKLLSHGACSGPSNGHEVESVYILAPQADLQETEISGHRQTQVGNGELWWLVNIYLPTLTFLGRRLHNSNSKGKSNWFCPQQRLSKSTSTCIRVPPLKRHTFYKNLHNMVPCAHTMQPLVSLHKFLMR